MKLYRAVVEDNNDPEQIGRVKVRIVGLHTASNTGGDFSVVDTEHLPWAEVMGSTGFGLVGGVGLSSVLRKGTWVWIMLEEDNPNKPVVMGTLTGKSNGEAAEGGFADPDGVYPAASRKEEPLQDDGVTAGVEAPRNDRSDMHPKMDAAYTTMQILETESGHLIELEDTDGKQRVKISHTSGSFFYIDNDGTIWVRGVKDYNIDIAENCTWNVKGNVTWNIDGTSDTTVGGAVTENYGSTQDTTAGGDITIVGGPNINLNP